MRFLLRLLIVLLVVFAGVFAGIAGRRVCLPVDGFGAKIDGATIDGVLWNDIPAYVCPNGRILIRIPGETAVIVDQDFRAAYYPGTDFYDFYVFVLSNDLDPVGVSVADKVKIEENENVFFRENEIEYTDLLTKHRIILRRPH